MPFLAPQHIVIDSNPLTAKDKQTGYNLLHPEIPTRKWAPERVVPPPTPPKKHQSSALTLENASKPALAGYLLPAPIMAAVCEQIETISYQEILAKRISR